MKRKLTGALGALFVGGTLLASMAFATPAQAQIFGDRYRSGSWYTRGDFDRDGIPNHRDRDDDNDGIRDSRDPNDRSTRGRGYYRNGRFYSSGRYYNSVPRRGAYGDRDRDGIRNRWDRDRDGDGRRNRNDDHPRNPRRR